MALTNMALFGGAFFTPILVGKITHTLGWQWSFYFIAIFTGVLLPFVFFFVPETAFRRAEHLNTDFTGEGHLEGKDHLDPAWENSHSENSAKQGSRDGSVPTSFDKHQNDNELRDLNSERPVPAKVSYARSLMPFNGRKTDDNFFKLVLRPFPLFFHPAIFWACLIQGTMIGWTVFIGVVLAAIYLGPPLFFNEVTTGYMYTGVSRHFDHPLVSTDHSKAFVGAVLGFLLAGFLADWSTNLMIRRNKGVYEPEFRIVLVVAQLVVGCIGLYGFGITSNNLPQYGWFLPDFFFAWEVMGMVIGAVASALYIVDAHRKSS